jgi:hypothetical protein
MKTEIKFHKNLSLKFLEYSPKKTHHSIDKSKPYAFHFPDLIYVFISTKNIQC